MKKKDKRISRRSFLKTAPAIGISAVSTTCFHEAHAAPLRVPSAEYGREQKVPVLCEMCAQRCPADASVKDGKVIRLEASRSTNTKESAVAHGRRPAPCTTTTASQHP